jgi:hypothetical protein
MLQSTTTYTAILRGAWHANAARTDHLTSQTAGEVAIKLIASEGLVPWSVVTVNRHISLNMQIPF